MKGQWLGKFKGTNEGIVTLNLDELEDGYAGYAHIISTSMNVPPAFVPVHSKSKANPCAFEASIIQVNSGTHATITKEGLKAAYPEVIFPDTGSVKAEQDGRTLNVEWTTNIGTNGTAALKGGSSGEKSSYQPTEMSWANFKAHMDTFEARKFIYRGQEKPWRLRTSFHRAGRADLFKFMANDIPTLHRVLSSRTKHIYNLKDPEQNGAFFHLVQHHGYAIRAGSY